MGHYCVGLYPECGVITMGRYLECGSLLTVTGGRYPECGSLLTVTVGRYLDCVGRYLECGSLLTCIVGRYLECGSLGVVRRLRMGWGGGGSIRGVAHCMECKSSHCIRTWVTVLNGNWCLESAWQRPVAIPGKGRSLYPAKALYPASP